MRCLASIVATFLSTRALATEVMTRDDAIAATALIKNPSGAGSGFLISDNHVVTNAHVIRGTQCRFIQVIWKDGSVNRCDQIVAVNNDLDIAVFRLKTTENRPKFKIANFRDVNVGDDVGLIGNPSSKIFTQFLVYAKGTVASKEDSVQISNYIYTNAGDFPINLQATFGNSGGPVINKDHSVVGIIKFLRTDLPGYVFALRSDEIDRFLRGHQVPFEVAISRYTGPSNQPDLSLFASESARSTNSSIQKSKEQQSNLEKETPKNSPDEQPPKPSDWSGLHNPFNFGGFKLAGRVVGGVDYGDYEAEDATIKGENLWRLWTAGVQGFFGAQIGIEDGGSSTLGCWITSSVGSPKLARNTAMEQTRNSMLSGPKYASFFEEEFAGEASHISQMEREFGIYLWNFWRISAGFGDLNIEIADDSNPKTVPYSDTYKILSTGFLWGSERWGVSLDLSRLYGGFYEKPTLRMMAGFGYTFSFFD